MKIKSAIFIKSCVSRSGFPHHSFPEFAFMGRSNVGKSSLINMILNRKDLVKTGAKPGVTRAINFFLADESISIADLPGFGYARLPKEIRGGFLPLIRKYLENRENLKLVFLLIDIRRIPGDYEMEMISLLTGNRIPVAVILTKCDKLSKTRKMNNSRLIEEKLGVGQGTVFFSSARTGEGKKDILRLMGEFTG